MDDAVYQKVQQYQQALKALQRSVERSLQEDTYEGTGRMAVKSYQGIQRKIAELLPDDFYITETLVLETSDESKERHMLSQVQLAASQMIIYLDGLARDYRVTSGTQMGDFSDLGKLGRTLGRELQEQIINMTKATISRAVSNIDIDVDSGGNGERVNMEGADLEGGNFSGRNLKYGNFQAAALRGCNFSGSNLKGANFEGADAPEANFSGSNLKEANFEGAVLIKANLSGSNLKGANLEGADLTDAKLGGANFSDANLTDATLPHGQPYRNPSDLAAYGATMRQSSTGRARVHIEIDKDDEVKRKNDSPEGIEDKPKNDDFEE